MASYTKGRSLVASSFLLSRLFSAIGSDFALEQFHRVMRCCILSILVLYFLYMEGDIEAMMEAR